MLPALLKTCFPVITPAIMANPFLGMARARLVPATIRAESDASPSCLARSMKIWRAGVARAARRELLPGDKELAHAETLDARIAAPRRLRPQACRSHPSTPRPADDPVRSGLRARRSGAGIDRGRLERFSL